MIREGSATAVYRNQYEYLELLDTCYDINWVTDIRESFVGAESVMHYLGRYANRIAISNSFCSNVCKASFGAGAPFPCGRYRETSRGALPSGKHSD